MAEVKESFGQGGSGLAPKGPSPSLAEILRDGITDHEALVTAFVALLAKLDADAGVTDTDYESGLTPAARLNSNA